jgi:hypothetical protein
MTEDVGDQQENEGPGWREPAHGVAAKFVHRRADNKWYSRCHWTHSTGRSERHLRTGQGLTSGRHPHTPPDSGSGRSDCESRCAGVDLASSLEAGSAMATARIKREREAI